MIRELVKFYETPQEGYHVGSVWEHLCRAPREEAKLKHLKRRLIS